MLSTLESEWLRHAISFSLAATSSTSLSEGHGPPEQRDPRFRKLEEGILYSRKLILTYHVVILVIILVIAAGHWSGRARTWSRCRRSKPSHMVDDDFLRGRTASGDLPSRPDAQKGLEGGSSSSSSTLEGTESPPSLYKDVHEETPLLHGGHPLRAFYPQRSIAKYIKAFSIYQPAAIPVINKALPSNGYTLIIALVLALNIFYTVFHINFTIFELFVFADRCGLVFVANLPLLYLLAAKTQPIRMMTGYSYESLNIIHRRLGELLCLEAFLHSSGMVAVWYTLLRPTGFTLARFLLEKIIWLGIGAFISYESLYFTSLASFRKRWYELFLGLHVILQASGLAFVFFHHSGARIYIGIATGIFLVDRFVYRFGLKSATFTAGAEITEDAETVRLSAIVPIKRGTFINRLLGRNITIGWLASDHVFVTVPSLGRNHLLQTHPFTIISPAPRPFAKETQLSLLIRAQRGFSSDLLRSALHRNSLTVRIDGPYGSHHARALLQASDFAILVAGGSGIAVARPLVHFLLQQQQHSPPQNPATNVKNALPSSPSPHSPQIILIWIIHRATHLSWVDAPALEALRQRGVTVIIPGATEEVGRPDLPLLIRSLVENEEERGLGSRRKVAVVASGPDGMGRTIRNTCAGMVWRGHDVGVLIEKFGW